MNGIFLNSNFLDWEWYDDVYVKSVFIHLLLKVNDADRMWKGRLIKRGQYLTSIRKLADEMKLDFKTIMRALDKLKECEKITVESKNCKDGGSLITVTNYNEYVPLSVPLNGADSGTDDGMDYGTNKDNLTKIVPLNGTDDGTDDGANYIYTTYLHTYNNLHTNIQTRACENESKEENNDAKEFFGKIEFREYVDVINDLQKDICWIEGTKQLLEMKGYCGIDMINLLLTFELSQKAIGKEKTTDSVNDIKKHFLNWATQELEHQKTKQNANTRTTKNSTAPGGRLPYADKVLASRIKFVEDTEQLIRSGKL